MKQSNAAAVTLVTLYPPCCALPRYLINRETRGSSQQHDPLHLSSAALRRWVGVTTRMLHGRVFGVVTAPIAEPDEAGREAAYVDLVTQVLV